MGFATPKFPHRLIVSYLHGKKWWVVTDCWKQDATMLLGQHCSWISTIWTILLSLNQPAIMCNNAEQYCWHHWTMPQQQCCTLFSIASDFWLCSIWNRCFKNMFLLVWAFKTYKISFGFRGPRAKLSWCPKDLVNIFIDSTEWFLLPAQLKLMNRPFL